MRRQEHVGKTVYLGLGQGDCLILVVIQQRQQALGQAGEVPVGDARLIAIGVTTAVIDGAKYLVSRKGIHECAGTIVDSFATYQHIVGVHHTVNKPQQLPAGYQCRLSLHDGFKHCERLVFSVQRLRVVASQHVAGEALQ